MRNKKTLIDNAQTKTRLYIFVLVCIVIISSSSYKRNKARIDEAEKIVSEWTGKEIKFPENVLCAVLGRDTISELCDNNFHKEYKILLYVDSAGCSVCRLDLFKWKQVIEEADILFPNKVGFLLFLQPKNVEEVADWILHNNFDYHVFIDTIGSINLLNQFPQMMQHQCYLAD
jgi:hypothetical protein